MRDRALAVTMGDPAGVGPEIIVKAWQALRAQGPAFLVIGDFDLLKSAATGGGVTLRRIAAPWRSAR